MEKLDATLRELGLPHPYRLTRDDRKRFEREVWYKSGSLGRGAIVKGGKYLYRLTQATNLSKHVTDWFLTPTKDPDPDELIDDLLRDYYNKKDWLLYTNYANGFYASPRGFSFWTSHSFSVTDIVGGANIIGMVSNYIVPQMVVLRIPVDRTDVTEKIKVPTVLNAFDYEVFHPTADIDNPPAGITINLKLKGTLRPGVDEYICGPLPVELIELFPIWLEPRAIETRGIPSDTSLWNRLGVYYEKL